MNKDDEGFREYVQEIHNQVVNDLQELYDKYKTVYGWENKPLIIE